MKTKEKPIPSDQRRALRLLAWSGHNGMTEALLVARGVTVETMVALGRPGSRPRTSNGWPGRQSR